MSEFWVDMFVRCGRCGRFISGYQENDPVHGQVHVDCSEDYWFDAGFSRRSYDLPMDMSAINPCSTCGLALPVTGICDCAVD